MRFVFLTAIILTTAIPSNALAQTFDIALLGRFGKQTLRCVRQDGSGRIRFDRGSKIGKARSFGVSRKRLRAAVKKVTKEIKTATNKKKKKQKREKRTAIKTLLAGVKRCQRNEQPLVLTADGAILTIPLSAIPEGTDPGMISLTANGSSTSVDGATLENAATSGYTFLPDGLVLNSDATFELDLSLDTLNGNPFFGILHVGLTNAARGAKDSGIQYLENLTDDVNPENVIGGPSNDVVRFGGGISNFSGGASLVGSNSSFLTISATVDPSGDIEVGSGFTVSYTITRNSGELSTRAGYRDEDSKDKEKDADYSLEISNREETLGLSKVQKLQQSMKTSRMLDDS